MRLWNAARIGCTFVDFLSTVDAGVAGGTFADVRVRLGLSTLADNAARLGCTFGDVHAALLACSASVCAGSILHEPSSTSASPGLVGVLVALCAVAARAFDAQVKIHFTIAARRSCAVAVSRAAGARVAPTGSLGARRSVLARIASTLVDVDSTVVAGEGRVA